jgi:hypothetical protein
LPRITATVFKPNVEVGEQRRFPVIAFGIGWNSWSSRYAKTLTVLASHGFIVIVPSVADRVAIGAFSAWPVSYAYLL